MRTGDDAIASDRVAVDMTLLVHGTPQPDGAATCEYDKCNTDMVANPGNIDYPEAMRTLFIGEGSGDQE